MHFCTSSISQLQLGLANIDWVQPLPSSLPKESHVGTPSTTLQCVSKTCFAATFTMSRQHHKVGKGWMGLCRMAQDLTLRAVPGKTLTDWCSAANRINCRVLKIVCPHANNLICICIWMCMYHVMLVALSFSWNKVFSSLALIMSSLTLSVFYSVLIMLIHFLRSGTQRCIPGMFEHSWQPNLRLFWNRMITFKLRTFSWTKNTI